MHTISHKEFEERLQRLTKRIEALEQYRTLEGVDAIARHNAEKDAIAHQLRELATVALQAKNTFYSNRQKRLLILTLRLDALPSVPPIEVIRLAQNLLAQKPIMLVTNDTFNASHQQVELAHIVLMDATEVLCFDYHFPGSLHESVSSRKQSGDQTIAPLASLKQAWSELQTALHGRYVVAFDLPLAELQLALTARDAGLPIPMLIGHGFLDMLLKYAHVKEPIDWLLNAHAQPFSDATLCHALAEEDVAPFNDTAIACKTRALHLLHALQAMAQGTLSLQEPVLDFWSEEGDLDFTEEEEWDR